MVFQGYGQNFTDGLNLGIKLGTSKLMGEMSGGTSEMIQEFDNRFSPSYDIEISNYLGNHWEIGAEIGITKLTGETANPNFSAEGWHSSMLEPLVDPVEYENKLFTQRFFTSYYLRNLGDGGNGIHINPFLRVGIGHLMYKAKLEYVNTPAETDKQIFAKGGSYSDARLTTAVFFGGAGLKASLSDKLFLLTSVSFNYVDYDFLDVVYNYTTNGERANGSGLYSEFKVGVFYSFGNIYSGSKKESDKANKSDKRKNKSSGNKVNNGRLPFAPGSRGR